MMKASFSTFFFVCICVVSFISCNNQTLSTSQQENDTLAIIQAALDSKVLDEKFYYHSEMPQLYTLVSRRRRGTGTPQHPETVIDTLETLHLMDSLFSFKGKPVKLSDTAYDLDRRYKIPIDKYKFPNTPKADFVIGLGPLKKIKGNEAWFMLGIEESNIDITAHLKKILGKWEVVDYEFEQY